MPDELLTALDRSLEEASRRGSSSPGPRRIAGAPVAPEPRPSQQSAPFRDRYPLVEIFVAAQILWGALLFLPGAQGYRAAIRALPYVASALLFVPYVTKKMPGVRSPGSMSFIVAALALLVLNLLHPTTQSAAGLAQCLFQLTIVAPILWAWKAVSTEERLLRCLRLLFALSALSAGIGVLQVYFPDRFTPQFTSLGLQMNESLVDSMTYEGSDGRLIVRPPGLTDQPGGASVAGASAAILGLGLTLTPGGAAMRAFSLAGAAVGLGALYLTQVRSLLLMCVAAFAVMGALALKRGKVGAAMWLVGGGVALVLSAYLWAASVGGEQVQRRYTEIAQKGAVQTFRENRGHFLSYTVGELLDEFPLGAGVGRWGMMAVYFGDRTNVASPPIYVEIQLTGWLLDGGILMWFLYGGGIAAAAIAALRLTKVPRPSIVADLATISLAYMALVVGMSFAGPVFNTQTGILFWFLAGSVYGVGASAAQRPDGASLAKYYRR
jgi:hypothetical protein